VKHILAAAAAALAFALVYLIFAFILWDLNAANWVIGSRVFAVMFGSAAAFFAAGAVEELA
jgi:hypothetical protein